MTLRLPKDIDALVQARADAGGFATAEEVLRDAMRPWLEAEQKRQEDLRLIREKIAEGDTDPTDIGADEVSARLDRLAASIAKTSPDAA
jgi:Arc/MetJ-type ribon-helix-helix transcriptional regulator